MIEHLRGSNGVAQTAGGEVVPLAAWSLIVESRPIPPAAWSGQLETVVPGSIAAGTLRLVLIDDERGGAWTGRALVRNSPHGGTRVLVEGQGPLTWSEGA